MAASGIGEIHITGSLMAENRMAEESLIAENLKVESLKAESRRAEIYWLKASYA